MGKTDISSFFPIKYLFLPQPEDTLFWWFKSARNLFYSRNFSGFTVNSVQSVPVFPYVKTIGIIATVINEPSFFTFQHITIIDGRTWLHF